MKSGKVKKLEGSWAALPLAGDQKDEKVKKLEGSWAALPLAADQKDEKGKRGKGEKLGEWQVMEQVAGGSANFFRGYVWALPLALLVWSVGCLVVVGLLVVFGS